MECIFAELNLFECFYFFWAIYRKQCYLFKKLVKFKALNKIEKMMVCIAELKTVPPSQHEH